MWVEIRGQFARGVYFPMLLALTNPYQWQKNELDGCEKNVVYEYHAHTDGLRDIFCYTDSNVYHALSMTTEHTENEKDIFGDNPPFWGMQMC